MATAVILNLAVVTGCALICSITIRWVRNILFVASYIGFASYCMGGIDVVFIITEISRFVPTACVFVYFGIGRIRNKIYITFIRLGVLIFFVSYCMGIIEYSNLVVPTSNCCVLVYCVMAQWVRNVAIVFISLDSAIELIAELIGKENNANVDDQLAQLYMMLYSCHELKQFNQVVIYANKYLDLVKETNCYDEQMLAYILLVKAHVALMQNDQAIANGKKCIFFSKEAPSYPLETNGMRTVFVLADQLDNPEEIEQTVFNGQKCFQISVNPKYDSIYVQLFLHLGSAYLQRTENEKALFYSKQVLNWVHKGKKNESTEIRNSVPTAQDDQACEFNAFFIIGMVYLNWCQYDKANDYFTRARTIAQHLQESEVVIILSEVMTELHQDVGICTSTTHSDVIGIIKNLGHQFEVFDQIAHLEKDAKKNVMNAQFDNALSCYENIEVLERKYFHSFHTNASLCVANMNILLKRFDTAFHLYEEILENAKRSGHKLMEAECHHRMALIHVFQGKLIHAETSASKSVECFDSLFDLLESEEYKISIVDNYIRYYQLLLAILVMAGRNTEALVTADSYRARVLNSQLIMKYQMVQNFQQEQLKFSDIQSLVSNNNYTIIQYLTVATRLNDIEIPGVNSLACIFKVPCENEEELMIFAPNLSLNERSFDEMGVRTVKCENRLMLDINNETAYDGNENIEHDFIPPLEDQQPPEAGNESSFNSALEFLYSKLIQDVVSDTETDEIVFIPDGPLFKVPFAALRDPETGLYLSETNRIRIAPSISTLKILNDRPEDFESKSSALIVGDPSVGKVMFNGEEKEFPPLLFSYVEAVTVSRVLGGQTLLRYRATKAAVLEKLREGVSVVHIAAHGNGKKGTIALAPSPNASKIPEEDDYMLTMADVQKANVRAKLVVLSCCHSGRGEIKAEGVVGMCRAFIASGARAVVASLWGIDDEATLEFMKVFYGNLKKKKSASLSLQLAMKHMMKHKEFSEPKYWAPFFLMGDDVTIF